MRLWLRVHEVLRGQGLLEGTWCLDPHEALERVRAAYPELLDDDFVAEHRAAWLAGAAGEGD